MRYLNKKLFAKIYIVLGVLSLIYFLAAEAYLITFAGFFAILGIILICIGVIKLYINEDMLKKKAKWLVYFLRTLGVLFLVSFIFIEGLIIYNGFSSYKENVDYVVVLGAMVRGETPSLILSERLNASLNYINEHPGTKIILSGGKGNGEDISEAEAMKRFLIQHGVNEERIYKEENSVNTMENIKFTKETIRKIDGRSNLKVCIVTSDFHMFRAEFLAQRNGFKAVGVAADTEILLKPTYYIREYFAVIKSFLFDNN